MNIQTNNYSLKSCRTILYLFCFCAFHTYLNAQSYEIDDYDGQTVNTCSGTFYDSNARNNGNYTHNEDYEVTFCSDNGEAITLNFTSFNTENNFDYLYVYDGSSTSSSQVSGSPFSGNGGLSGNITSSGTCLTFRFTSDGSRRRSGWIASISCASGSGGGGSPTGDYNIETEDGNTITTCTGTFVDSGDLGSNYGDNDYHEVTFCSDDGTPISLDFTSFQTESFYDYLYVYDGSSTSASQLSGSPFHGTGLQGQTITSTGTCLTFLFDSDGSFNYSGWEAEISCGGTIAYKIDAYDQQTVNVCSGDFYDWGGTDSNYDNDQDYEVTFCSDNGDPIILEFTSFFTETSYDFLYIYDGANNTASQLSGSPFEGDDLDGEIIFSSGTCLTFVFESDGSVNYSGWEATISCGTPPVIPCDSGNLGNCCDETIVANSGFEDAFTPDEQFPNSSLASSNNAREGDFSEWFYADGGYNLEVEVLIDDPTRASEGDQFVYIPLPPDQTGPFNYCIGNTVSYSSTVTSCEADTWFDNLRYVYQVDWMPFNRDVPGGGTGSAYPTLEYYQNFNLLIATSYDENGNVINSGDPAVAWNDVGSSWRRLYGVTAQRTSNSDLTWFISNNQNSTTGILIDDAYMAPLRITDPGLDDIDCGSSNDEITFTLNPISNIGTVQGILYDVCVDSEYTISPSQGTYNTETTFTITKVSGNFNPVSPDVDVVVMDEINQDCSVTATITNPYPCGGLPVELTDFNGKEINCDVQLNWTSAVEEGFSHYELQRSDDEVDFHTIVTINAEGGFVTQHYQYTDHAAFEKNYYRLKMVDIDGSIAYSDIVEVSTDCGVVRNLSIYPNPVGDRAIYLKIDSKSAVNEEILIVDVAGKVIQHQNISLNEGFNTLSFDTSNLIGGIYFVKVGNRTQGRFVKVSEQ